jgi:hypothetical protein
MLKLILILLAALFLSTNVAFGEVGTDKFAHAGVSYALNMTLYGVFKKAMQLEGDQKYEALIMSIPLVLTMGLAKEAMDVGECERRRLRNCQFDTADMAANIIGIAVSTATVFVFDF